MNSVSLSIFFVLNVLFVGSEIRQKHLCLRWPNAVIILIYLCTFVVIWVTILRKVNVLNSEYTDELLATLIHIRFLWKY